jgi:hypothetical protein
MSEQPPNARFFADMPVQPHNARFFAAMAVAHDNLDRELFPVTIVMARYRGTFEGGQWLAFPIAPEDLADSDYAADDISCMIFFESYEVRKLPIGRGSTPDEARADLRARLSVSISEGSSSSDRLPPGEPHERDRADD